MHTWWQLLSSFFVVGLLGFGGGFGMIPLMKNITLDNHWLTASQFTQAIAMGQITPGPVAISATFIGDRAGGLVGAVLATIAIFLPSILLVILLTHVYHHIRNIPGLQDVLSATLAGVVGLIAAVTLTLGRSVIITPLAAVVAGVTIFGVLKWKWPYWAVIVTSAIVGALLLRP